MEIRQKKEETNPVYLLTFVEKSQSEMGSKTRTPNKRLPNQKFTCGKNTCYEHSILDPDLQLCYRCSIFRMIQHVDKINTIRSKYHKTNPIQRPSTSHIICTSVSNKLLSNSQPLKRDRGVLPYYINPIRLLSTVTKQTPPKSFNQYNTTSNAKILALSDDYVSGTPVGVGGHKYGDKNKRENSTYGTNGANISGLTMKTPDNIDYDKNNYSNSSNNFNNQGKVQIDGEEMFKNKQQKNENKPIMSISNNKSPTHRFIHFATNNNPNNTNNTNSTTASMTTHESSPSSPFFRTHSCPTFPSSGREGSLSPIRMTSKLEKLPVQISSGGSPLFPDMLPLAPGSRRLYGEVGGTISEKSLGGLSPGVSVKLKAVSDVNLAMCEKAAVTRYSRGTVLKFQVRKSSVTRKP